MIIRTEKDKNYTLMSKYHLEDETLSLSAKGLLTLILSTIDEWSDGKLEFSKLSAACSDDMHEIIIALNELEAVGYITRDGLNFSAYEKPMTMKRGNEHDYQS